jgi:nicotinate-nucleotide adenylyltransferase
VRVGLFGGTFDPPHLGHLLAASDACEALELDRLVFVPNSVQPLKSALPAASAQDRLEMVRRLCQDDARFGVDPIEVERGGLSYTVDTLRAYRDRHPGAALFLLVGADVLESLPAWRDTATVLELAQLIVLTRGAMPAGVSGAGRALATRQVEMSSTEIRARVRAGLSIKGFVPDSVAAYIVDRRLYLETNAERGPTGSTGIQ